MKTSHALPASARPPEQRHEIHLAEPLARVWHAMTDRESLAEWLLKADFKARVGHRFRWEGGREVGQNPFGDGECEIEEVLEQPGGEHRLSFKVTFAPGNLVSFVTWTAEPAGDGTRVVVRQEFLSEVELKPHPTHLAPISLAHCRPQKAWIQSSSDDWTRWLARLRAVLASGATASCKVAA